MYDICDCSSTALYTTQGSSQHHDGNLMTSLSSSLRALVATKLLLFIHPAYTLVSHLFLGVGLHLESDISAVASTRDSYDLAEARSSQPLNLLNWNTPWYVICTYRTFRSTLLILRPFKHTQLTLQINLTTPTYRRLSLLS